MSTPSGDVRACGVCGGEVKPFLDFGDLPLGNVFLKLEQLGEEKRYRLELGMCVRCKLVQQTRPPPKSALEEDYRNYHYVPFGDTLAGHYQQLAAAAVARVGITDRSLVYDIGSNNGLFLGNIGRMTGCQILGVEPAKEIAKGAIDAGIPTVDEFFTTDLAVDLAVNPGKADLIACTQTLQHIPDVNEFVKDMALLLKPEGMLMVEGRYWGATVEKGSYDTVYHEMQWFFTLKSLHELLRRNGLHIVRAEETDVYGGSLRVYAKKESWAQEPSGETRPIWDKEQGTQLNSLVTYKKFAKRVQEHRSKLHRLVESKKREGKKFAAYGAPSTSATLLNFCHIDSTMVDYIVDDSRLKQGLYHPGTHIRIVPSEQLWEDPPDWLIINAWRLRDELITKLKKHRPKFKVLIPLPEIEVLEL